MKKLILTLFVLGVSAFGQATAPVDPQLPQAAQNFTSMPKYVLVGMGFDQTATPMWHGVVSGVVPVYSRIGMYASATADVVPIVKYDPVSQRNIYTFAPTLRAGVHKTLYPSPPSPDAKLTITVGGDSGFSVSPGVVGGSTNVNLALSMTVTAVYRINTHFGIFTAVRALYLASISGWNLVPEAGGVWIP